MRRRVEIQKLRDASLDIILSMNDLHRLAVILRNPRPKPQEMDTLDELIGKFVEVSIKLSTYKPLTEAVVYFHILMHDVLVYNRWTYSGSVVV